MGWASGSELLGDVVLSTQKVVPKRFRKELYKLFINHFEQFDCDTICECEGLDPLFDEVLKELYGDWREEEE